MGGIIYNILFVFFMLKSAQSFDFDEVAELQDAFRNLTQFKRNNLEVIKNLLTARENDPDKYLNSPQLAEKYGLKVDTYYVITQDGYNLTMYRARSDCSTEANAVLLGHGLFCSSDEFLTPGPESGIAFLLAENCYDVWIINYRGNKYSRKHISLNPDTDAAFWKFSFDQMGRDDMPATIDYILNVTGQSTVKFVCHSQGCTNFLIMGAILPEYSKKVSISIGLSLLSFVGNTISPAMHAFAIAEPLFRSMEAIGIHEFADQNPVNDALKELLCGTELQASVLCSNILFLIGGFDYTQINVTRFKVLVSHVPSGVSLENFEHWGQLVRSGKFRNFDHGWIKNKLVYGSYAPPDYNVSNIETPVAVLLGQNDWLAREEDQKTLFKYLPNVVEYYKIPYKLWNHFDFIWGKDLSTVIFPKILEVLEKY